MADCCALCVQSLFLESLSGQQAQAAEVALAQAAARDAVGERLEVEHMLTWLTGAHAEEAAMHRTFKAEVYLGMPAALVHPHAACVAAVDWVEGESRLSSRPVAALRAAPT